MPISYITIPRGEYESLLSEVRRGAEVCVDVGALRIVLQELVGPLTGRVHKSTLDEVRRGIEACDEVSRLRVELAALERRLREFDQELTPVRPASRQDIKAAFDNSVEFARGTRKPPSTSG